MGGFLASTFPRFSRASISLAAGLAAIALLLAGAPAGAGMSEALTAAKAGDFKTAFAEWSSLAEDGVAAAQYNLAQLYRRGKGVKRNYTKAAKWYRAAAENFYDPARYNLALMYERGLGVPLDYAEALKWYLMAANQGYGPAQFNLGVMYSIGQGAPRDYPRAHMWYSLAARTGDGEASSNLRLLIPRMTPEELSRAEELMADWQNTWGKRD